jgi:hypothetical protein
MASARARWPFSMEIEHKVILPIWHQITVDEVSRFSPTLAGRYAARASEGVDAVVDKILKAIMPV